MEMIEIKSEDIRYPKRMLKIKNYPKRLYVMGNTTLLNSPHILAVVGSRNCSEYGRKVANSFAKELAKKEITIISGLAIGIDAASHIGSMAEKRENHCCIRLWIKPYVSKRK